MTSALINITSDVKTRVTILDGHGEVDIGEFASLLVMNAYQVDHINLLTETISPDTAVVIMASPDRDLSGEELGKIDAFLASGGTNTFFYLAMAEQPALPNLAAFLAEWGIGVEEGMVFETDTSRLFGNSPYLALVDYAEDEFSKKSAERGLYTAVPQSRPLRMIFEGQMYRTVTTLLKYSAASGIRPAAVVDWQPASSDITGNVPVLMLSRYFRTNMPQANVLVCGSLLALNEYLLGSSSLANGSYFLDVLGSLSGKKATTYIENKTIQSFQLGTTLGQVVIIGVIFVIILPLAILITGIVIWLRRRHK
jgi:hypothetical protein